MKTNSIIFIAITICLMGCSTMNTTHICLDCNAKTALAENDPPDLVGKTKACWHGKYDSSKDKEGTYCIYWDENYKIHQYGFESYEQETSILIMY